MLGCRLRRFRATKICEVSHERMEWAPEDKFTHVAFAFRVGAMPFSYASTRCPKGLARAGHAAIHGKPDPGS